MYWFCFDHFFALLRVVTDHHAVRESTQHLTTQNVCLIAGEEIAATRHCFCFAKAIFRDTGARD